LLRHHREGISVRPSDLQRLFDYNYWANARLFAALDRLTPEQFVGTIAGSYGSIRNTLVHVLSAEWGWLDRCGGARRGDALRPDDYPTIDVLRSTWATVETQMRTFLSELSDAHAARSVSFALGRGPVHEMRVGDLLEHAAMHAAHHRGQVALLLREHGVPPGNFDFLLYVAEVG
jgi:uncharacterized damage-inducible protein DinB